MRQNPITIIFVISLLGLVITACQTMPVERFSSVKNGMSKDEVLENVGSPNRTERFDGKEKWAYRYFTGENKDQEELKQITFANGHVISFGPDTDEDQRLKEIQESDEQRAVRRKAAKAAAAAHAVDDLKVEHAKKSAPPKKYDDEPTKPQTIEFKEIKGKPGPVGQESED